MLQTRNGKRTAAAALKIAVDMVSEGLIDRARGDPARSIRGSLDQLLHPTLDPKARAPGHRARACRPRRAPPSGAVVFTADEAEDRGRQGRAR